MTKLFTDEYFLAGKFSTDEYFLPTYIFSRQIFFPEVFGLHVRFLLKTECLDDKFRFLPNFMTENPIEIENNAKICPFFVVLLRFHH